MKNVQNIYEEEHKVALEILASLMEEKEQLENVAEGVKKEMDASKGEISKELQTLMRDVIKALSNVNRRVEEAKRTADKKWERYMKHNTQKQQMSASRTWGEKMFSNFKKWKKTRGGTRRRGRRGD